MEVLLLDPKEIVVRKGLDRLRSDYGDISDMVESIKKNGQIHPILVTRGEDGRFELVAGGRRLAACSELGVKIQAVVRESLTDLELRELELEENLQRKDLTWQERVLGVSELDRIKREMYGDKGAGRSQKGWSYKDTANVIGQTPRRVAQMAELARAIKDIPEIAEAKTEQEARKILHKIEEKLLLDELARRRAAKKSEEKTDLDTLIDSYIVGDAIEGMKGLPSETFDFANVDTPFGIDLHGNKRSEHSKPSELEIEEYTEWSLDEYKELFALTCKEVYRLLKNNSFAVFWFPMEHYPIVTESLRKAGFSIDEVPCLWYSPGSNQTNRPEKYLASCYVPFIQAAKGEPVIVRRGVNRVFIHSKTAAQNKIHPTEMPIDLIVDVMSVYCLPHSKILSPYLGSGIDILAGYKLGHSVVGFDSNATFRNRFIVKAEEFLKELCTTRKAL